jgi:aldose 1-epimerase
MAAEPAMPPDAMAPLAPGPLIALSRGTLDVTIAPQAGGRIAQIVFGGIEQLVGYSETNAATIAWGSYPMLPWAGRVRNGRFEFQGSACQLPLNLEGHAIHGVGFAMPWKVETHGGHATELSLALPEDERWPFGGVARQRIVLGDRRLEMSLSVTAGATPMPAVIGWHPWFHKPERLDFSAESIYPRDLDGLATLPLTVPTAGPWDDCFINHSPVTIERAGQTLRLSSDCDHWVVYDQTDFATCVEPQSGPPDGFNLKPEVLSPGATLSRQFLIEWTENPNG